MTNRIGTRIENWDSTMIRLKLFCLPLNMKKYNMSSRKGKQVIDIVYLGVCQFAELVTVGEGVYN